MQASLNPKSLKYRHSEFVQVRLKGTDKHKMVQLRQKIGFDGYLLDNHEGKRKVFSIMSKVKAPSKKRLKPRNSGIFSPA